MKRIGTILITLLVFAVAFADVRLTPSGFIFIKGDDAAGYPRTAEVIAIMVILFSIIKFRINSIKIQFYLYCSLLFVFASFKPYYMGYYRSACLVPTLLFTGLLNFRVTKEYLRKLFIIIFYIISFSSTFVIISPFIDLGVEIYNVDIYDSDAQRFIGFGQSLPYQALFSLMSIPLFFYIIDFSKGIMRTLLFALVLFNTLAVVMTGARTAFGILFVLFLYYNKEWRRLISPKYLVVIGVVIITISVYFGHILLVSLIGRNDAGMSERDTIWFIALLLILTHPILGIQDFDKEGRQFGNVVAHSQNGFFELIFWGGLLSFILYWLTLYKCYILNKIDKQNKRCFMGVLIIYMIFSVTEIIFFSVQAYYIIVIVLGLLTANAFELKKEKRIITK